MRFMCQRRKSIRCIWYNVISLIRRYTWSQQYYFSYYFHFRKQHEDAYYHVQFVKTTVVMPRLRALDFTNIRTYMHMYVWIVNFPQQNRGWSNENRSYKTLFHIYNTHTGTRSNGVYLFKCLWLGRIPNTCICLTCVCFNLSVHLKCFVKIHLKKMF